jgi:hypothetical protein
MDTFIIIISNIFSTIFTVNTAEKLLYVIVPAIIVYGVYRFKKSEKLEDGLYYWWGGGSKANPTQKGYISGQTWTTVDKLKSINYKNKKTKNCIKFDNFKYHPDYIKKTKMPKFKSNSAGSLEMHYTALSTTESVLFIGGAGSGKTVWLRNLINQRWYKKAVIFSKKADNEVFFFRPGIDFMLSPKVEDGAVHDILSENVQYIELYIQTLMHAVIGDKKDFFSGSALQKLQTMAQRVKINSLDNVSTTQEKWIMFIAFIEDAMKEAKGSEQKSEADVMDTARTVLELLYLIAYRIENGAVTFTVEQFFLSGVPGQRLFLTGTDTSLEALLSASLAVLVKYQLSMRDIKDWDPDFLVGYFLDEYLSLDKIIDEEILSEMSRVGRSKGINPFKGVQFIQAHEKKKTQELIANVSYIVIFSTTDTVSLKILQEMAGEIQ